MTNLRQRREVQNIRRTGYVAVRVRWIRVTEALLCECHRSAVDDEKAGAEVVAWRWWWWWWSGVVVVVVAVAVVSVVSVVVAKLNPGPDPDPDPDRYPWPWP